MPDRELVDTGNSKQYIRRDEKGRFKQSVEVGRSLSADRRTDAKDEAKKGQGDRGDPLFDVGPGRSVEGLGETGPRRVLQRAGVGPLPVLEVLDQAAGGLGASLLGQRARPPPGTGAAR